MEFATIKGFKDILPEEVGIWQRLESEVREVFRDIELGVVLFADEEGAETDVNFLVGKSEHVINTFCPEPFAIRVRERRFDGEGCSQ